jgi:amidophosphoribosyltransferase
VAARSYARKVDKPFVNIFYKMRGERSFQGSNAQDRKQSIDNNLHVLPGLKPQLAGKTVVLIDDSIVRGNNSIRARELLYEHLGVKKAYLVSYTPPIGIVPDDGIPRGCMFGVDMPPDPPDGEGFIARGCTTDEISRKMDMPVVYVSVAGMLQAFQRLGLNCDDLCTYCIGGSHPFANSLSAVAQETPQLDLLSISSGG